MKIIRKCKICGKIIWPWQERYENKDYHQKCVEECNRRFTLDLDPPIHRFKPRVSAAEFIAAQIIPMIIGVVFYIFLPEKTLENTVAVALFAAVIWFGINMGLALEEFTP